MALHQASVAGVKWSVIWRKKGKWVRKRFGNDLGEAIALYEAKHDQHPTIHSDNVGFPPPDRITHHERVKWEIVVKKGKRYKKKVVTVHNLMREYNDKGVWWCPYCIKLRPFKFIKTERGPEMYCPVCQISNYDFHVRKHNPKAAIIEQAKIQRRTTNGKPRRRRRAK